MFQGRISKLDLESRTASIVTSDDREVTVHFPADANIEVSEPNTMGTMGGDLCDLQIGYTVQVNVRAHQDEHTCTCASLLSIS